MVKALDALDEVIALIRRSQTTEEARDGLKDLLEIDDLQARAILEMQLRRLAALERQKIIDALAELETLIAELEAILASDERQRQIVSEELQTIVDKFGDARRSIIIPADGDLSMEDLIPDEDVIVSITRGGYAKRVRTDQYRLQKRGGKGVRGATLRGDDVVDHLFATTAHHWILFFTTAGRVYRTKAYYLPESSRESKGGHVAGLLSFQPDERIAQVLTVRDYEQAPYLVLATRNGYVKKTRLADYNSPRQAGLIAINFREEDDELIGAELVSADDDLLLISHKGQAVRFRAHDTSLRPMGRATSGVTGMRFRAGDHLLSMSVIRAEERVEVPEGEDPDAVANPAMGEAAIQAAEEADRPQQYLFTVTDGGFAKKTVVEQYRLTNRGGLGVKAAKLNDERGGLVAGLVVTDTDEVLAIRASGQVTRSPVADVRPAGRDTMGQIFARANGDPIVAIARNAEKDVAEVVGEAPIDEAADAAETLETDAAAGDPVTDGTDETQEPE
jgi:DNA gyrase subunit A